MIHTHRPRFENRGLFFDFAHKVSCLPNPQSGRAVFIALVGRNRVKSDGIRCRHQLLSSFVRPC